MKKTYIQPNIEKHRMMTEQMFCALSKRRVKGNPYARFGSDLPEEYYGNAAWVDEGHKTSEVALEHFDAIRIGGDDFGELDSRAGTGSLWDE